MRSLHPLALLIALAALAVTVPHRQMYAAEQNPAEAQAQSMALHLREACQQICVEARTAGEVSRCVVSHESIQGFSSFQRAHPDCFDAHQKYESFLQRQADENEPERYG